ncbi:MAG TPA: ABC transporter ATP-binding protein [Moraxellaceae bacterium]|nr:ABC transporter ATP-binding protein [Moraxellaceae bacterium]
MSSDTLITAQAVCKSIATAGASLTILHDVSLTIKRGESVAIVGASGSGKTTLLGLLAGLDSPSSGHIEVCGTALESLDEDGRAALRKAHVGFVFQSFLLMPNFTALENVMLALSVNHRGNETTAREWLERVGLGNRLGHTPRELSGGEQQRVALARAFAGRPDILFADEPTGNLDSRTGAQIIDLLFSLNGTAGTTLVLVTHDPQLAARCSRQLHLENGRLVEGVA